jgi:hypothetical protein
VPDLARRGGGKAPALRTRADAEREIAKVEKLGARFLALGQGLYPRLLAELEDAPPLLIAKGNLNLLDRQAVAIVGARNASAAACRFARGLAHDLGQNELVVVSGLARGIDSAAHDGGAGVGHGRNHRWWHRHFLSARERSPADGDVRARAGARRNASGHRASGAALPLPKPDHCRDDQRDRGGRSGTALGLADHGPAGG